MSVKFCACSSHDHAMQCENWKLLKTKNTGATAKSLISKGINEQLKLINKFICNACTKRMKSGLPFYSATDWTSSVLESIPINGNYFPSK